jgi:hypothetical protein
MDFHLPFLGELSVHLNPPDEGINNSVEDEKIESPKGRKVLRKSPTKTMTNLVLF